MVGVLLVGIPVIIRVGDGRYAHLVVLVEALALHEDVLGRLRALGGLVRVLDCLDLLFVQ